jgi:tetratricopeptide (TPR) repeat protein
MALAMMAVAPIAAGQFSALGQKRSLSQFVRFRAAGVVLISVALTIAALGGPGLTRAGIGIDHRAFPEGAARFLAEHQLGGNLFNSYEYGNYLLFARYPENRVFIDGRVDVYGPAILRLYAAVAHAAPGWQKILDQYSIEICALATEKSSDLPLLSALHRSPDWALVYWDDISAIYIQRAPDRQAFLSAARVYTVRPDDFDPAVLESPERLARAEQDYRARLGEDPNFAFAAYGLARCLIQRDQRDEAAAILEKAVALEPEKATYRATLGTLLLLMGRLDEARRELRAALDGFRRIPGAQGALSAVYWDLSLLDEKKGDLESALSEAQETFKLRPEMAAAADRVRALQQKIAERRQSP